MISKEEFIDFYDPNSRPQRLYGILCQKTKCISCSKKFPDGIVFKAPGKIKGISAEEWFTGEFLHHFKETHGFTVEDLDYMLENL